MKMQYRERSIQTDKRGIAWFVTIDGYEAHEQFLTEAEAVEYAHEMVEAEDDAEQKRAWGYEK